MATNRKETTAELSRLLEKYLNPKNDTRIYVAREVTFDYYSQNAHRVDYMRFKPVNQSVSGIEHGDFFCYEVKSCLEDYRSKHGHNFFGDFNYYVMPVELYEQIKAEIPYYVGVLCPKELGYFNGESYLEAKKKAHRKDRDRPVSEMLLMMYRSAVRDYRKASRQEVVEK